MLSALIYTNLYLYYLKDLGWIKVIYEQYFQQFSLGDFMMQVLFTGLFTIITWVFIALVTWNKEDHEKANQFIKRISVSDQPLKYKFLGFVCLSIFLISTKLLSWYLILKDFGSVFYASILFVVSLMALKIVLKGMAFEGEIS
jgi:hypothetical protein